MECIGKITAVLDLIQKLDNLGPSADTTKIRDTVVKTIQEIVAGLRECIGQLGQVLKNMPPGQDRDAVEDIKRKITSIRDSLQSDYITLAKAYAQGGDNRDRAHFTVLELGSLLKSLKSALQK